MSQRCVATQGSVPGPFQSGYKICIRTLALTARALCPVSCALPRVSQPPALYRGAFLRRIAALALCIVTKSRPPQPRYNFFFFYRDLGAAQLTIQTLYRSILTWPGCMRATRCVAGLLGRVAVTAGHIVAMPSRVAPPSWRTQAYVPAQPTVCLLSLLCATIQPAVL